MNKIFKSSEVSRKWPAEVQLAACFLNKVLLKYGHDHFFIAYGYFLAPIAQLYGCDRDQIVNKTKNIYCLVLYRKMLLNPWARRE